MVEQRRLIEKIIAPSYLEGMESKGIEVLRTMRDECKEAENELSFERRLCHARIDILSAELDRRAGKSEGELLDQLPQILAGTGAGQSSALPDRAPDLSIPRNADIPRRRVEEIVGEQTLARLSQISEDEIRSIIASLGDHEAEVSARRRGVHDVMDRIQAEIVRRYTSGEADPTAALG
jgi:hypothetical protein